MESSYQVSVETCFVLSPWIPPQLGHKDSGLKDIGVKSPLNTFAVWCM